MILVAGGTGRLGRRVVERLVRRGLAVRVLTRDPRRAGPLRARGVDVVRGDVRAPETVDPAMNGVRTVVSAVHGFASSDGGTPASIDRDGNFHLVDAATRAGADVVLVSIVGASANSPMDLFRAKYAAEDHLRASGARWTIVRATAFVELWAELLAKGVVFGRGDNPINFVSVEDVADAVERAIIERQHRGRVLEIGGPGNATFNELVAMLSPERRVRHVPRWVLRAMAPFSLLGRAAVAMDTADMTFDARPARAELPDVPITDLSTAIARWRTTP